MCAYMCMCVCVCVCVCVCMHVRVCLCMHMWGGGGRVHAYMHLIRQDKIYASTLLLAHPYLVHTQTSCICKILILERGALMYLRNQE